MSEAGAFFAVDRRSWADVCDLGSINAAVAYLVLARGTLKDHRTTSWSTNAIEGYTRMPRHLAKEAVARLVASRYVDQQKGGSKPRYYLTPWPEDEAPDWVWLPASIIDGAANEMPPVALLRQSQNLPALRLFVDLYAAQSLERFGGVSWRYLRQTFERQKVGTYGAHTIWGFTESGLQAWGHTPPVMPHLDDKGSAEALWPRLYLLRDTGLVSFVPHVIEADTAEAGVLFPFGVASTIPEERELALAAQQAGAAMLADWQLRQAEENRLLLVPLLPHHENARMVGVARLRYQAGTEANARWYANRERWAGQARAFLEMAEKAQQPQGIATSIRDQFGI